MLKTQISFIFTQSRVHLTYFKFFQKVDTISQR